MKKHFDRVGGYRNVERARRRPPDDWTAKAWNDMIDLLFLPRNTDARRKKIKLLGRNFHTQVLTDVDRMLNDVI